MAYPSITSGPARSDRPGPHAAAGAHAGRTHPAGRTLPGAPRLCVRPARARRPDRRPARRLPGRCRCSGNARPRRRTRRGLGGPGLLVVDGYADLDPGGRPGLGAHAHAELGIPVIGVAKSRFRTATHAVPVLRGSSARPLFVTAAGMPAADAADLVRPVSAARCPAPRRYPRASRSTAATMTDRQPDWPTQTHDIRLERAFWGHAVVIRSTPAVARS